MTDLYTWLESLPLSIFIRESNSLWAFPMFLFAHTLGMSIVAGGASLIDLALLGCWPSSAPVKPLERLYPAIWFGFWVNLVTGSVLLAADATKRLTNPDFFIKMACVFAGVFLLSMMRKRVFLDPQLDVAPVSRQAKVLAWLSLICWYGAILTGRLLAYTSTSR
jgi:hypothetical protein